MKTSIRLKLDMAGRVRGFNVARPSTHPGHTAAVQQLDGLIVRAEALAQQAIAGDQTRAGAIAARDKLREEIDDTLALLSGLARQASREQPDLVGDVIRPGKSINSHTFLSRGRVSVATAARHRELLQRYGMPDSFPEDLGGMLDEFEKAINAKHAGQAARIGAHAELDAVTLEIMRLIRQLDAINRFRFRHDAEALSAWRSARNVAWPAGDRQARPTSGGDVRPAA